MKTFKFLTGITPHQYGIGIWRGISIDGYKFRIYTDLSAQDVMVVLRQVSNEYCNRYIRMRDDHMNRDRLLELLQERFNNAVNVIDRDELVRNGGYI